MAISAELNYIPDGGIVSFSSAELQYIPDGGIAQAIVAPVTSTNPIVSVASDALVSFGEWMGFQYDFFSPGADLTTGTYEGMLGGGGYYGGEATYTIPSSPAMALSTEVICDICGLDFKYYELHKRWDGFKVCDDCYETRHILDFFKIKDRRPAMPPVDHRAIVDDPLTDPSPSITGEEGIALEPYASTEYPNPIVIAENGDWVIQE